MQRYEENLVSKVNGVLQPLLGVSVTVTDENDLSAALYSDNGVTPLLQPLTTDANGYFGFYAANGSYIVTGRGAQIGTITRKVELYDPADAPPATLSDLAAPTGASKIGVGSETVENALNALQLADYTALRAYAGPRKSVYVTGYLGTAAPSGIAGMFVRDDSDTTTADNGGTVIVAGNGKRWKRQYSGAPLIDWFGTKGDGITDDTTAVAAAFAYALAKTGKLNGYAGSNYKVSAKIAITAGNFDFDGCNCLFTNAISNATAADSMFEMASTSISNVRLAGFRVAGTSNNGHIVSVLGALSTGPQFITLERIWVQSNAGNGKDHSGNPIPAQLLYAYGGMTLKVNGCVTYLSGGIWCEQTLKIHINDATIDSPPAGRLVYLKACNNVVVDGACVFNGGTTDQLDIEGCNGVLVQGNRLKGGTGRQFYAHGVSSNIAFKHNQHEVYTLTSNAVEFTTAVASPVAKDNSLAFINGSGSPVTFTKSGIAMVDEPGGGFLSYGLRIEGNGFIVNSLITIASLISVGSALNSVRSPRINSNVLAILGGGSVSTITKGIDLSANVLGALVEENQYGATTGNTMTTGISVAASCTGTRLIENTNYGNTTTPISDAGSKTTRREGGVLLSTSFTPTVIGLTTAGTATYTTQTGSYTLDGTRAKFDLAVTYTGHTGAGIMAISLPFTGAAGKFQVLSVLTENLTYTGQLKATVNAGDPFIRLWGETAVAAATAVTVDTAATLYISGVLEIA